MPSLDSIKRELRQSLKFFSAYKMSQTTKFIGELLISITKPSQITNYHNECLSKQIDESNQVKVLVEEELLNPEEEDICILLESYL